MSTCLICEERDAGYRYACTPCVRETQKQLRELETYGTVLSILAAPTRDGSQGGGSGYGSRAPAQDDIVTAMDPRSGGGAAVWRLRDPRDMDDEPVRSIVGSVRGIACWIREEQELASSSRWSLTTEIAYLMGQIEWAAMNQWVCELADDIKELWRQARSLAHDQPPPSLGACLTVGCEGVVYAAALRDPDGSTLDGARCARCRRTYAGLYLVKLAIVQEATG